MKKLLLLGVFFMASSIAVNAQTYFVDHFDSQGSAWTNVDNDGDGYAWIFNDYGDGQGTVAGSASYINSVGALTPDNLLISPLITLGTTNLTLNYVIKGLDASYSEEHYAVYVTTSNTVSDIIASTPVLEETLPSNTTAYIPKSIDLSAYANQSVYITFRHYNITDMYWLVLDDVVVGNPPTNDVAMQSIDIPVGTQQGNFSITGTVKNYGASAITTLYLSYDAGSGAVNDTITGLNIPAGATYDFTDPTPLALTIGNSYTINVCASVPSDSFALNNCLEGAIRFVLDPVNSADKYVVVEEKTGTWCGWCPRGTVALDQLHANQPKAFEIAVHNADPMALSFYDSGTNNLPDFDGYPYAAADRSIGGDAGDAAASASARLSFPAPASVSFDEAKLENGTITITPKVTMVTTMSGDFRLAVVLTEDSVKGSGQNWLQTNYYSSTQANADLIAVNGVNWKDLPGHVDQSAVFGGFNHVARAVGNNAIEGDAGSLPGTLVNGQSYTYTYTFTFNPTWKFRNMHAIAMLIDKTTGEILNAFETEMTGTPAGISNETAEAMDINVYPNPTSAIANITFNLKSKSDVNISLINSIGEVVSTHSIKGAVGKQSTLINVSGLNAGIYLVKVQTKNGQLTKRLSIIK